MDIRKALIAAFTITCIATASVHAQINVDPTSPQPPNGAVIPTRDNSAPNHSMDTSRSAHRRTVKPPKEPNYDNKTVTPRGTLSKKSAEKQDEKNLPK